jgi:hypothetical protein
MIPLVAIPELVEHYAPHFEGVFRTHSYEYFKRYLSGLLISENKTVEAINRLFVLDMKDQSSQNRFLTEQEYDLKLLNDKRMELLNSHAATQLKSGGKDSGVLSLDDTLLTHHTDGFEDIALLYDHSQGCYCWAHNTVNLHYSDDQVDYPIDFKLWKPANLERIEAALKALNINLRADKVALRKSVPLKWRQYLLGLWRQHQQKEGMAEAYKSKLHLAKELLQDFFSRYPDKDLPITFDNWYTVSWFCRFIHQELKRAYVGTLKGSDSRYLSDGKLQTLEDFAQQLKTEHQQADNKAVFRKATFSYKGQQQTYYAYCKTHHIKGFGKQKLVISFSEKDLSDKPRFYISNQLHWHAYQLLRTRRHRWPVEVYYQEGKAEGMGQYQIRYRTPITRHIAMVVVLYSLLQLARHDQDLLAKLQQQLHIEVEGSLAFWRKAMQVQAIVALLQWAALATGQSQHLSQVIDPIVKALLKT